MTGRASIGLGLTLLLGCAAAQRDSFIHQEVSDYVYELPAREVWPHAKALLAEEGYAFKEAPNRFLLTTEWQEEMGGSQIAASYTRYLVEAVPLGRGQCRVRFIRNSVTMGGGPGVVEGKRYRADARSYAQGQHRNVSTNAGSRDLHMEWLLLRRAAPQDAAELQSLAEARYR